jgi:hypothetical protein
LGTIRVLEGDATGWQEFSRGVQMRYWYVRLLDAQWEADKRRTRGPRVPLYEPPLYLAAALALRSEETIQWLGDRLERSVQDGRFGDWDRWHLPPFALNLYQLYVGKEPNAPAATDPDCPDPYAAIFAAWHDEAALVDAIRAACDYHVEEHRERGDHIGEFAWSPFHIVPAEIFALQVVRNKLGLPTPHVEHPLLEPPLDRAPEGDWEVHDDLLERVKRIL